MTPNDLIARFDEIWLHDFEFIAQPGERPDVVCLAARELRSGRTLQLWRDRLSGAAPYRTDDRVLFVNFVANAELACHLALDWPVPRYVLDLNPAFRNLTNGRHTPEGKGLLGALSYYGIDNIGSKKKDAMHKRIMQGWPFTAEEQEEILAYCLSDAEALKLLLPKILAALDFDLDIALYHGEAIAVLAKMQHRGVPIDMEVFTKLADKEIWRDVRDAMVPVIDAQYGIYVRGSGGDWTFDMERFGAYLAREGILGGWPRTETGKLSTKRKVFEDMSKGWPQLEDLRQLRHARDKMRRIRLEVGADGRNRTVLWPFKAKTSRTQPKASKWIFSPAVWLRSLIKPEPGMAIAYIDYSAMEFLLAAALSGDARMLWMYLSDPYLSFAQAVGAIPEHITKKTLGNYAVVRDRYKVMLLAVQYGMQAETLAGRLGVSTFEAHEMLSQHHAQLAQYWAWSEDFMQHAFQTGGMHTAFGWHCCTGMTEFNERTIRNWPIQAAGADILRIACILGERHGIRLLAPVHDAVLIEAPIDRIEADVALMREIMRRASRIVINADAAGAHELRTDYTIVRYPDRYSDKRGEAIWERVTQLLAKQDVKKVA
jgi:DNA polymerase I